MIYRLFFIVLLFYSPLASAAGYDSMRKPFWAELYGEGGWTLYCGEFFRAAVEDPERLWGLNIEHVYPASWMAKHLGCGSRKQCRRTSERFNQMEADPHNLWPSLAQYNQLRSNFAYGDIPGERWKFSGCDFEVQGKRVEPSPRARGRIARAMLYMRDTYGLAIDDDLMLRWHRAHPVDDEERRRARIISARWGLANPWLDE
ncbi:MAG: endonuclease [Sedimenticola sp.]